MWLDEAYRPLKLDESTLKAIIWASAAVAFPFVPFRLFVRWKIAKKLFIDDGLVVIAYGLLLAYAIMWQNLAHNFYIVFDSLSGRIPPPSNPLWYLQRELHDQVAAVLLYGFCLWCIKLAFLLFFQRLGNHVRRQRILWWFVLGYNAASFAVWMGLAPWRCIAVSPEQTMAKCGDQATAQFLQRNLKAQTSMDVTSDVAIILLPVCLLWNLKIGLCKKFLLGGIFSLTVFTMIASITRIIVVTSKAEVLDESWKMTWIAIEMSVAIIVACLGSFRALYTTRSTTQLPISPPTTNLKDSSRQAFARAGLRDSSSSNSPLDNGTASDARLEMSYGSEKSRGDDGEQEFSKRIAAGEEVRGQSMV